MYSSGWVAVLSHPATSLMSGLGRTRTRPKIVADLATDPLVQTLSAPTAHRCHQTVIELAEYAVEQLAQRRDVPVTSGPLCPVAGCPQGIVPDRGQRPDVSGRGDPVVFGTSGVHEAGSAR